MLSAPSLRPSRADRFPWWDAPPRAFGAPTTTARPRRRASRAASRLIGNSAIRAVAQEARLLGMRRDRAGELRLEDFSTLLLPEGRLQAGDPVGALPAAASAGT